MSNAFAEQLARSQSDDRATTTYTFPPSLVGVDGPKVIKVRLLYSQEELDAAQAGGYQLLKSQYEATKRMIVAIDGKPMSVADGSIDRFWERADPKVRDLLVELYNKLTSPSREEKDAFFKSAKTDA